MSSYRILMYSHDSYGLGHIRRSMAIATQLRRPEVSTIILTGSPIVGRFNFPEQIDFVRVPGMIKQSNDTYTPHSIKIEPHEALAIRQGIIQSVAKTFKPDLFIVDKAPLGLKREILPTLRWLRRPEQHCRTVLGLRDVMDDAESTIKDWRSKRIYDVLERYYSEIWVYGEQELYDPVREYQIPESISRKMVFTGYIPREPGTMRNGAERADCRCASKLVLVTTGGGGDGYPLVDAYLRMHEERRVSTEYRSVIVTGPFMPTAERQDIARRARSLGIKFYHFYRRMEQLMATADLVVCMGGYNTTCEVLSNRKVALIVPRETPRMEQTIRAEMLQRHHLADCLHWSGLTPQALAQRVDALLADPGPYKQAVERFRFTGMQVMRQRLEAFQSQDAHAFA